jgi:hypothetical protein
LDKFLHLTTKTVDLKFKLRFLLLLLPATCPAWSYAGPVDKLITYPAPKGELTTNSYQVTVNGRSIPVYPAKIGAADDNRRFKAVDDILRSEMYHDLAAFTYFDFQGRATITVRIKNPIRSAVVLPASAGIKPKIEKNSISFQVTQAGNFTVELNGEWVKSLHIFVNPIETTKPSTKDTNVIFFAPGIHEVSSLTITNNKTVYIAGGAVVRLIAREGEPYSLEPNGLRNYHLPAFNIRGNNIRFRGRGIIDASRLPTHARTIVDVSGNDILVEGIIIRDPPGWTVPLRGANRTTITNIKILGYRGNSDGIDICNSNNILVEKCFIRTNDDLIVVKTWEGYGKSRNITVTDCVLFNQLAHGLLVGPELREDVEDVVFKNCDIIHDQGREPLLRVFHSDASKIKNVRFENIRVAEADDLISIWVGKNASTHDKKYGTIKNVVFKNITAAGAPLHVSLSTASETAEIEDVTFDNVILNGKKMSRDHVKMNKSIKDVKVK